MPVKPIMLSLFNNTGTGFNLTDEVNLSWIVCSIYFVSAIILFIRINERILFFQLLFA
jgi:hypothetical protein